MDALASLVETAEVKRSPSRTPKRKRPYVKRDPYQNLSIKAGFDPEPVSWPDDGGAKRLPLYDRNVSPPRLMRKVGWVNCLGRYASLTPHRIFSPDVIKVRMCDRCKRPDYSGRADEEDS
jgi:hypothetical protein